MTARHTLVHRITMLSLFERFLQRLSEQIRYTALPMGELLRSAADTEEFSTFPLLQDTVAHLSDDGEFRTAWKTAVREHCRGWVLSEQETTLFLDFADGLGTADITGEVRHCQHYAKLVGDCVQQRKEEMRTRGGLYTALGFCGGSAAALLLL